MRKSRGTGSERALSNIWHTIYCYITDIGALPKAGMATPPDAQKPNFGRVLSLVARQWRRELAHEKYLILRHV